MWIRPRVGDSWWNWEGEYRNKCNTKQYPGVISSEEPEHGACPAIEFTALLIQHNFPSKIVASLFHKKCLCRTELCLQSIQLHAPPPRCTLTPLCHFHSLLLHTLGIRRNKYIMFSLWFTKKIGKYWGIFFS